MLLKKICNKKNIKIFSQTKRFYKQKDRSNDEGEEKQLSSSEIFSNLRRLQPIEEKITEATTAAKEKYLAQIKRKKRKDPDMEEIKLKNIKGHLWDNMAGFKYLVGKKKKKKKKKTKIKKKNFQKAPQINKEQLQELLDCEYEQNSFILIDVRSFLRGADFQIPKSVNIPRKSHF